ncbi:MAG TPA: CPBP family intramembrane glutamic endopeptidase [Chryseosolibacter sp.]
MSHHKRLPTTSAPVTGTMMPPTPPRISDVRRKSEIAAVLMTALGKFVFMDWLQWKLPFILIAIAGWSIYAAARQRQVPGILRHWGFRVDNVSDAVKIVLPLGLIAVVVFAALGFYLGTIHITWHIIPVLLLYPVWGTIQQFLVIAIVAGNLKDMERNQFPSALIIFVTALLFGLLHYPFYWLMLATFVLALVYGAIYLKVRNVYVLGLFHGWLGAMFFYLVSGRDPFLEVFGKFL